MEFRKGILFIRLRGDLTRKTIKKLDIEVTNLIKDNGIRNVLFNLSELDNIDIEGIKAIFANYQLCKRNHGQTFLCPSANQQVKRKISNSSLLQHLFVTTNELSAFSIID